MNEQQEYDNLMFKHFHEFRKKESDIMSKQLEIIKLKDSLYKITGFNFSDINIKGKPKEMFSEIDDIIEKENKLKELIYERNELRKKYENEIDKLNDTNMITILKAFYLDHQDLKTIGNIIDKSISWVKQLKSRAIKELINNNLIAL